MPAHVAPDRGGQRGGRWERLTVDETLTLAPRSTGDPRRTQRVAWRLPVLSFGERQPTTSVAVSLARPRPAPGGRASVRPRAQSFSGGAPGGRGQGTLDVRAAEPPEGEGFSRDSGRRSGF